MTGNRTEKGQFTRTTDLDEYKTVFESYGAWLTGHTDNQRTIDARKRGARYWLNWCEKTDRDALTADDGDVRDWLNHQANQGIADTTLTSRFASVSKFYRWVMTDHLGGDDGNLEENPTEDVDLERQNIDNNSEYVSVVHRQGRQNIIAPSFDALKPLFDVTLGLTDFVQVRNELICRLLWQTALRSDELSRARVDNVDLDNREIEVRSAKLNRKDHPDLYHRKVFFEPNLDYLLHRYLDKREDKNVNDGVDTLIVGNRGGKLKPPTISRTVKRAGHEADIQEPLTTDGDGNVKQWLYTAHRLRHARITHLANKTDLDLNYIRMIAGHAQISTTVQYVSNDWSEARTAFHDATGKK